MTPEAGAFLDKARKALDEAEARNSTRYLSRRANGALLSGFELDTFGVAAFGRIERTRAGSLAGRFGSAWYLRGGVRARVGGFGYRRSAGMNADARR